MIFFFGVILLTGLIVLSQIDLRTFKIPDHLTFGLLIIGLVQAYYLEFSIFERLLAAVLGYSTLIFIELSYKYCRRKDGLGRGDAKLLAVGGAWCGVWSIPMIVLIASLSAILVQLLFFRKINEKDSKIAFGPFLSLGIMSAWIKLVFF